MSRPKPPAPLSDISLFAGHATPASSVERSSSLCDHEMDSRGRSSFVRDSRTKPAKTYGKATKLLPLSGKQFRSVYDLEDSDEDDQAQEYLMAGGLGQRGGGSGELSEGEDDRSEPDAVDILRSAFTTGGRKNTSAKRSSRPAVILDSAKISGSPTGKKKQTISKPRQPTPARNLPVNELFLVASRPYDTTFGAVRSYQDIDVRDPITTHSSSPFKRNSSPCSSIRQRSPRKALKTPLTNIRRRLHATKWRYKLLAKARKPNVNSKTLMQTTHKEPRGRDGFEISELTVRDRPRIQKKPRARIPLISRFDALQLGSGPLPEVQFDPSAVPALETQFNVGYEVPGDTAVDNGSPYFDGLTTPKRQASFGHRAREKQISLELSLISAPPRPPSESDSDEEVGEESEGDKLADDEGSHAGSADAVLQDIVVEGTNAEMDETDKKVQNHVADQRHKLGVSLEFRRPELRGQASVSRSVQRRKLMEVNESIIEVPDTSSNQRYTYAHPDRRTHHHVQVQQPRRARCILRNSTPMIPDSTSAPEHTEANTRRNSMIEVDESRYFASASSNLNLVHPTRHIIMPRRRSHYFNYHQDVEVPDSDHVLPETSPQRLQYTTGAQLNVLRRTSEAIWASSADGGIAAAPKDLRTLTRMISREHGTLSQSRRRRSSLPFQPPTKLRNLA